MTGALGGREWIEEHADPTELYGALRRMARVAVPFGDDLQTLVGLLVTLVPDLLDPTERAPAESVGIAEVYEFALAEWHLSPPALEEQLDARQLEMLWDEAQKRIARERRARLGEHYRAAVDAGLQVLVSSGRAKRVGAWRTPALPRPAR